MTLRHRTFAALQWTTTSAVLRGMIQLVQLSILARFLTPAEFGQAVAVISLVAIGSAISDLGLNSAYLQARSVDEEQRCTLYWLNVILGLSVASLLYFTSPLASHFFPDSEIPELLKLYCPIFIISAAGQQLRFDAEKRLCFDRVAMIEMASAFIGASSTVGFAIQGYGPSSIICGALIAASMNSVLNWILLSMGWRPRPLFSLAKTRSFLSFGLANVGNNLLGQFSTSLDMLIGGRIIGINEYGLYSAPRNLFNQVISLVNPIINRVGFPLVAHLDNDRERISSLYQRMLRAIVGINAPIYLFAALYTESIVPILFGERWIGATDTFQVLALWGLSRSIMNPIGNLLFGMGRPGLALKWNMAQVGIASLALPLSAGHGAFGLALTMLVLISGQIVPAWYILVYRLCGLPLRPYLKSILLPLIYAFTATLTSTFVVHSITSDLLKLVIGAPVAIFLYIGISWIAREEWWLAIWTHVRFKFGT